MCGGCARTCEKMVKRRLRDGDRAVVLGVSSQRSSPSQSNSLLFALSRHRFRSRRFGGRCPWVPRASRGAGVAGCCSSSAAWTARVPGLARDGAGPGRCPHDPSVKSGGGTGVREAQRFSDAGPLGSVTLPAKSVSECRLLAAVHLGEAVFGGCAAALPRGGLRSVRRAALGTASVPGVLAWPAGAARCGAPAPREGAQPPLRGPTARPAVWADDVAGVVTDRRTRARGV